MSKQKAKTKEAKQYTYSRDRDGVDSTWNIYNPEGEYVVSIHFWEEADGTDGIEAAVTEERAKLIVDTLNKGYQGYFR